MTRFALASRFRLAGPILICILASAFSFEPARGAEPQPPAFRLPTFAHPLRNSAELTLVPDKDTFAGAIDIDLEFKQASPVLWLNAQDITVKDATLKTGGETLAAKVTTEPKDLVGFSFNRAVGPGPARLHVVYEGKISRKDMQGIFQVKDGDSWYIYSRFEDIGARRAFPCFDEPNYKVPWQLTLHVKRIMLPSPTRPSFRRRPKATA